MNEVAKLMSEGQFRDYLDAAKGNLEDSGLISYTSKVCHLAEIVTVTAGHEDEKHFSATQLSEIFALAK